MIAHFGRMSVCKSGLVIKKPIRLTVEIKTSLCFPNICAADLVGSRAKLWLIAALDSFKYTYLSQSDIFD